MPVTRLEIVDTTIKIVSGAIVGGVIAWFLEWSRHKRELEKERRRRQYEDLVKPIVQFVDDLMEPICQTYWNHLDPAMEEKGAKVGEKIRAIRNKEGLVEARVNALSNPMLSEKFKTFTHQLFKIQMDLGERKVKEAGDKKDIAFTLGGEILNILYEVKPGRAAARLKGNPCDSRRT